LSGSQQHSICSSDANCAGTTDGHIGNSLRYAMHILDSHRNQLERKFLLVDQAYLSLLPPDWEHELIFPPNLYQSFYCLHFSIPHSVADQRAFNALSK
jgi:hypothetical protein